MWLNRTAWSAGPAGSTSRVIDWSANGDAPFTATAGNLLVILVGAPTTTAWPGGWTEQLTPSNNTEISVGTKTAAAGESSVTVTNNGDGSYSAEIVVYEFMAGSTYVGGAGSGVLPATGATPSVSGLPGTAVSCFGAVSGHIETGQSAPAPTATWTDPVIENYDNTYSMVNPTASFFSVGYQDGVTATSWSATVTVTDSAKLVNGGTNGCAKISFAINAVQPLAAPGVNAGQSRYLALDLPFQRTAIVTPNGATVTDQSWSLQYGPGVGSPTTISSTVDIDWTPSGGVGEYGLRFSATNSQGTTTQDITITVVDVPLHSSAMAAMRI